MGMLTLDGTAEEWGDFAQDAMANGGMGAVWGAVLVKAAPVIARSGVGQWAEAQATRVLSSAGAAGRIEGAGTRAAAGGQRGSEACAGCTVGG